MTALEEELLRILTDESAHSPMTPGSLHRVLYALGWSPLPDEAGIVVALDALLAGGWIEAVHSARLGKRYRVPRNQPGVDMSEPGTAA
jgi:hypothetical protein